MQIVLTTEERANLAAEAAKRGMTTEQLLTMVLAKLPRPGPAPGRAGVKSNGWCPRRAEYLDNRGEPTHENPPKPPARKRGRVC